MMTSYNRFQKIGRRGLAVVFVLDNIKRLVSADLSLGKKNQVILEYTMYNNL